MNTMDFLLDLLYPPACLSCGELQRVGIKVPLCPACQARWEELRRKRCPRCGEAETVCGCLPDLLAGSTCRLSALHLVPYEQSTVAGKLILLAKEERIHRLTAFFADQLADTLRLLNFAPADKSAVITYLPRSGDRKAQAGTDPAEQLAKALSKRLDLPLVPAFSRKSAPPQKELSAEERLRSARRTYRLRKGLTLPADCTVLLVDDILTTGATLLAGAELLRTAGAGEILAVTVGRSVESYKKHKK